MKYKIKAAKELYTDFAEQFRKKLNLSNPTSIHEAYEEAKKQRIFKEAESIRELLFGKDVIFYGVEYLSDLCENQCKFCPGSMEHADRELRMMTVEQAVKETEHLLDTGFHEICYLAGEYPGVDETHTGLAQCGGEVVFLALVVRHVGSPEQLALVADAVIPVVQQVITDEGEDPGQGTVQGHLPEAVVLAVPQQ